MGGLEVGCLVRLCNLRRAGRDVGKLMVDMEKIRKIMYVYMIYIANEILASF